MQPTGANDILTAFFDAIERGDLDLIASIYGDDLQVWHSNDGITQGKADNLKTLRALTRLASRRYEIFERVVAGEVAAQRHRLHLTSADGAQSWSGDAAIFFTIRDGRIVRIDEYIDSGAVRELTAMFSRRAGQ